jgi:PIF1-like helicase
MKRKRADENEDHKSHNKIHKKQKLHSISINVLSSASLKSIPLDAKKSKRTKKKKLKSVSTKKKRKQSSKTKDRIAKLRKQCADAFGNDSITDENSIVLKEVTKEEIQSLTLEQQRIYDICVNQHKSRLILGCAGSGKTFLGVFIVQQLRYTLQVCSIVILVPTGMASGNFEGSEVMQAFLGLPPMLSPPHNTNVKKAFAFIRKHRPFLILRIRMLRVLTIDEISMMTSDWFDFLSDLFSLIRDNNKAFGGCQVIAIGDPYQLPPVISIKKNKFSSFTSSVDFKAASQEQDRLLKQALFFRAENFLNTFEYENIEELTASMRQKGDSNFCQLLDHLKIGELTDNDRELLEQQLVDNMSYEEKVKESALNSKWIPHIFCTNRKVRDCNDTQLQIILANLDSKYSTVEPKTGLSCTVPWSQKYLKYYALLLENYKKDKKSLYKYRNNHSSNDSNDNGTDTARFHRKQHAVQKFVTEYGHMEKTKEMAALELYNQFSKKVETDAFLVPGVLIMLTKNIDITNGLYHGKIGTIKDIDVDTGHPLIRWEEDEQQTPLPPLYKLERYTWNVPFSGGKICYVHYPVNYAWATTIHKFQGKTARFGIVTDLSDAFIWGQVYSAVSRVTCLSHLRLLGNIRPTTKLCHPDVVAFVKRIQSEKQKKLKSIQRLQQKTRPQRNAKLSRQRQIMARLFP